MDSIVFACPWAANKNLSWSGTHLALQKALEEYYNLIDIDTAGNKIDSLGILWYKVARKWQKVNKKAIVDAEICRYNLLEAQLRRKHIADTIPILEFDASNLKSNRKSYIYIDVNYGFIKKLYDTDIDVFNKSNFRNRSYHQIVNRMEYQNNYFDNCSGIFTMGHWLEKELIEQYENLRNKIHCVGGGCNVNTKYIRQYKKTNNKILFIGREFERKNGWLVIEAFKKVKEKIKGAELYIAGTKELHLNEQGIHVLGDLNSEELAYYLNICDIFCMPSKFEAYGLVFAEALIFGLPCIGLDAYEMPYFIEDGKNGYLLKKESADELALLMIKLLENEQIKKNVVANREGYIEEYSWKNVAKRMKQVIDADRNCV